MCHALKSFKELQDKIAVLEGMNKRCESTVKKYESMIERYESRLKAMEHAMNNLMRRLSCYGNPYNSPSQCLVA